MVLLGFCTWNSCTISLPICLSIVTQQQNILLIYLSFSFLSLSVVLITDCLCHKWLDVHYKKSNPFKTILKVLNYARKTKYPERRSAFTYIDEEEPSRLDYGKHKFGGPFTEEKVEDVKTIFRLLPLFLSVFGALVANDWGLVDHFQAPPTPMHPCHLVAFHESGITATGH